MSIQSPVYPPVPPEYIDLGSNVYAIRVKVFGIEQGLWVWHGSRLNTEDTGYRYCKFEIPRKMITEIYPLTLSNGVKCPKCGISGYIEDGIWAAA